MAECLSMLVALVIEDIFFHEILQSFVVINEVIIRTPSHIDNQWIIHLLQNLVIHYSLGLLQKIYQ